MERKINFANLLNQSWIGTTKDWDPVIKTKQKKEGGSKLKKNEDFNQKKEKNILYINEYIKDKTNEAFDHQQDMKKAGLKIKLAWGLEAMRWKQTWIDPGTGGHRVLYIHPGYQNFGLIFTPLSFHRISPRFRDPYEIFPSLLCSKIPAWNALLI